ncbi:MAG: hypothetical protein UZ05_CHB002000893 [Chlorobi bacterium OLB5]|nr:MAG: hypothetical protein UZ05_CHB002000893 [Chlorobi bacterium OLB5]
MKKKLSLKKVKTTHTKKDDKVSVIRFSVSPPKPAAGSKVTVKMTIKNVSDKLLKHIPWQIVKNKKILCHGVRNDVPAGNSFQVSVTWTAIKGNHFFYGDADPKNVLREPKIKQFNNLPQGSDIIIK